MNIQTYMRKAIYAVLLALIASMGIAQAQYHSQDSTLMEYYSKERRLATREVQFDNAKAIYSEFLGPSATFGINYDARFDKTNNGLGWRAGLGLFKIDGTILTVPVGLNYLIGKRGSYLELGVGATYLYATTNVFFLENSVHEELINSDGKVGFMVSEVKPISTVFGNITFGYRFQPLQGGFLFRLGFSPVLSMHNGNLRYFPFMPYLGLGYAF